MFEEEVWDIWDIRCKVGLWGVGFTCTAVMSSSTFCSRLSVNESDSCTPP